MGGRLAGRVAIVTGGGGGIGAATGRVFCEQGAKVALVDREEPALRQAEESIRDGVAGAELIGLAADLTAEPAAERAVAATLEAFGTLDLLVNNAGIRAYEPLAEAQAETWRRILETNLLSYAYMAKAALPSLRAAGKASIGKASIVNVSSTYGVSGRAGMGQYDATKAAIIALTRTLAFEEIDHGVRVNAICPGSTLTPFHVRRAEADGRSGDELRAQRLDDCLMQRWADPREIALPILWLASDEASYMTAATLMVDGGRPVR